MENPSKTLKSNKRVAADCVFPIDRILSQLVSVAPASCLGILLFFSSSAFGEASLTCMPVPIEHGRNEASFSNLYNLK